MKKIKLNSKLNLNKQVISKLDAIKGGADIETSYRYACSQKSVNERCPVLTDDCEKKNS